MKEYSVYFDIFGKKLKAKVNANTPEEAGAIVRKTLSIDKIEENKTSQQPQSHYDHLMNEMEKMFGDEFKHFFGKK